MTLRAASGQGLSRAGRLSAARLVATAALAACLGGCVAWPDSGTGGLAELYPSKSIRITAIEERFREMAVGGVEHHAPAQLLEARGWLIRAKREHAGGLLADADHSASQAEFILDEIDRRFGRRKAAYRAMR